ncbi:MAG: hypothetical protein JXA28_13490 [Bacteroidetes bacterium]|nr:hypothetical protein [Bacteroidota bacterium]
MKPVIPIVVLLLAAFPCAAQTDSAKGALEQEFHRLVQEAKDKDSALTALNREQVHELTERYEEAREEQQIALFEREKRQRDLRLAQREDELMRRRMQREEQERDIRLLAREKEIRQLELESREAELRRQQELMFRQNEERIRRKDTLRMQTLRMERESMLRGITGAGLLAVLLFLGGGYWNFRSRREAARLREEAAANRVHLVEAKAFAEAAAAEQRERTAQQEFTARLIVAQEEERSRIAGALHDGVSQDLIIMKFRATMAQDEDGKAQEHLAEIVSAAADSIEEVRRMSRDLRPSQLERVGLTATLDAILRKVRESTALAVDAEIDMVDGLFSPEEEIGLYRIVQEAMNNILKHAGAQRVEVQLRREDNRLHLLIRDDGAGFDQTAREGTGLGLRGMQERTYMLGGTLHIESAPGKGTTLRAEFLLKPIPVGDEA